MVPYANWCGVLSLKADGLSLSRDSAWRIACPQADTGSWDFISNGRAISWSLLITDSAIPFWKCTWGTEYCVSIPADAQKSSKVRDVNSPALSTLRVRIGLFGNCAWSLMILARILGKTKFLVDNRETWDHFVDESMMTKK